MVGSSSCEMLCGCSFDDLSSTVRGPVCLWQCICVESEMFVEDLIGGFVICLLGQEWYCMAVAVLCGDGCYNIDP